MKVIRKILYAIAVASALLCVLVIACAFRPELTEKIEGLLYKNHGLSAVSGEDSGPGPETESIVYLPEDGGDEEQAGGLEEESAEKAGETGDGAIESEEDADGQDESSVVMTPDKADYVAPDESDIVIPDSVSGRNGYRQVQGEEEQVDDAVAGEIRERLDTGYTGDGLTFDAVYYPFYAMLDDQGQHIYRQIYANANALYGTFMPVETVTAPQLKNIFEAVYNDHPELFFMETAYACKYMRTGQCVEIALEFNRTADELESARADFESQVSDIVAQAQNLPDVYTKEKFVHDELLDRITYNARAEMNQSAYSALVNGQSVCAGYARAFQCIMQRLEIPCYYCTGYAGESHAWNIVALEDGFYNVDATWDDSGSGKYDFFNKTDADYASNHIRQDLSVYLPPCNGQMYRNLEQSGEDADLRSLADVGIAEEQVITDMARYYEDCYNQIMQNGIGRYTFYNVIEGEQMLEEWDRSYQLDNYKQAYMERAMTDLEANHCEMALEVEALQGGRYLVVHDVTLTD